MDNRNRKDEVPNKWTANHCFKNLLVPMIRAFLALCLVLLPIRLSLAQTVSITPGVLLRQGIEVMPVVAPSVRLEFDTDVTLFYQIESSVDLNQWKSEGYAFAGNGRRMAVMVSNHGSPQLFYRVRNNATEAEMAPVNPYGGFPYPAQSSSTPAVASTLTSSSFDPANHRLMVMDSSGGAQTLREITISELRKVPGMGFQWGDITGNITNQPDLQTALSGKFSTSNPPGWSLISGKPSSLLGYGISDAVTTSTIGFMDRFSRYPEGAVLLNNKTRPEVGSAWRYSVTGKNRLAVSTISVSAADSSFNDSANGFLDNNNIVGDVFAASGFTNTANNGRRFRVAAVTAGKIIVTSESGNPVTLVDEAAGPGRNLEFGYPPYVSGGALRAADNTLFMIGGAPIPTPNGRFSISFEVELRPSIHPTAVIPAALTIGIRSSELTTEEGGYLGGSLIHCQLDGSGVKANDLLRGGGAVATNQGPHPIRFKPGVTAPNNTKYLITLTVDGDEMRVSALGGTVVYKDPRLPAYIGNPNTHWFYETAGDSLEFPSFTTKYANVFHLHRVWANAAELDRTEGWGIPSTSPSGVPPFNDGVTPNVSIVRGSTLQSAVVGSAGNQTPLISVNGHELGKTGDYERATIHGNFPNQNPKTLTLRVKGQEVWSSGNLSDTGEWTLQIDRVIQSINTHQLHIRYESETTRKFGFHQGIGVGGPGSATELRGTSGQDGDVIVRTALTSVSRQ